MEAPVIQLASVTASYEGERIATLYDITLRVGPGERVAVVGPNGAGKTTLLEIINGLLPFASGSVRVFGECIEKNGDRLRAQIAYMPQEAFFEPSTPFLVADVVLAALFGQIGAFRWPSRTDCQCARSAMADVGIFDLARRPVGRLSGGQQRKALLARALAQRARLLLLDEPTANLDPEAKLEVARLVRDIQERLQATALIVSHESGPLLDDATRLLQIDSGRIVQDEFSARQQRPVPSGV